MYKFLSDVDKGEVESIVLRKVDGMGVFGIGEVVSIENFSNSCWVYPGCDKVSER
jgi:hypothetical protein